MSGTRQALAIGVLAVLAAVPAAAQDSLDRGKTGAQLYAANCALCHKSPAGLAKAGGLFGLSNFLRDHYTASRESAAAISAYLDSVERAAPPSRRAPPKRTATGSKGDRKPEPAKPGDAKPSETKPTETKASETKPTESKPAEAKPAEAKPAESKPSDAKAGEAAPAPASKPE